MSQIGRTVKNLEAPRPLKSQSRSQIKNYMLIEELIQLIENVAMTLASGISNPEPMTLLVSNLRVHGPQLESISKDTLDRAFVTFRNASQDERLNIMTRLNLLELIELRAKSWQDDGINTYYKHKATNVEPEGGATATSLVDQTALLSTSPTSMVGIPLGQSAASMTTQILAPGELIRTSGKFTKPTKIPGKNYSKDEVVIRNADSGKVMGIKGRRVHMIEELSETIISFQRVNPGAKERLVQITGPNEEKINYAKQLIEDTIRRNASPVRLEPSVSQSGVSGGGGSCSSLASSASDETVPRANNRNSVGAIMGGGLVGVANQANFVSNSGAVINPCPVKTMRCPSNNQMLLHSFSTNDASLGEYKYTVNVGQHLLKITGDCCDLVRVAKLVLDDYFSSNEFLASVEAGASFDSGTVLSSTTPTTSVASPFVPSSHQLVSSSPFADSGIGLNYMATQGVSNNFPEGDDDVFVEEPNPLLSPQQVNGLARSRRSHFSRKDSATDGVDNGNKTTEGGETVRIIHEYERLLCYSKSPHSWALPRDWNKIVEKHPTLVRNKVKSDNIKVGSTSTIHHLIENRNIVRKGFFSRTTYSIDETAKDNECSNVFSNNEASDLTDCNNITNRHKLTVEFRCNSTSD